MSEEPRPRVTIVGASIGGMTLGILLDLAGVSFRILERQKHPKYTGSAIFLGPQVIPLFKQMGIYDEFIEMAKPCHSMKLYNTKLECKAILDFQLMEEWGGTKSYIIARTAFASILAKRVQSAHVLGGKKVLHVKEYQNCVTVTTADGSSYDSDIVVGADGAYSAVRQNIYKTMGDKVPPEDVTILPYRCVGLIGQTVPLTKEIMPMVEKETAEFVRVVGGDKPYSWLVITTKDNSVCWFVTQYLDKGSLKDNDSFRNSEWGEEAAREMCAEVASFPIPGESASTLRSTSNSSSTQKTAPFTHGKTMTLGDLMAKTPEWAIRKVMQEEKVFETWNSDRVVLLGNACHKESPAGGMGAISAIHDAVALANWLHIAPSNAKEDVATIFEKYKAERRPMVLEDFQRSLRMSKMSANNTQGKLSRMVVKRLPDWIKRKTMQRLLQYRPQVAFLPLAEDRGTVPVSFQLSLHRSLQIQAIKCTQAV